MEKAIEYFHCGWPWFIMLASAIWPEGKIIYIFASILFMCLSASYVFKVNDEEKERNIIGNMLGSILILSLFSSNFMSVKKISMKYILIFCLAIVAFAGIFNSKKVEK